jgi:alkylation response protein AidB-like acyl-CoA dehydrogenase
MVPYTPPIDDYRLLLDMLGFEAEMAELGHDLDADTALAVLDAAGTFCAERLAPLNRPGDEEGSRLVDGAVTTPAGFAEAYRAFVADGWPSLAFDPAHGGQGLPFLLQLWLDEMGNAANVAFGLFPGLTRGAAEAVAAHASPELREAYLPRLVSGEWTGAMALTEAQAGTDLALLRSKAEPLGDGSYAVTGTKIFISSGDHDFANESFKCNVIHLVLARLPEAPPGVKGISLFLVPKQLPDGTRNTMSVGALEKKMGIHAQPTCVMNYDGAKGWLVGEAHRGLAAMFTMMNAERLSIGIQGLGLAGAAYQQAAAYAKDRLQGVSSDRARTPVAIIAHADVRRMLLEVRCFVEGARALAGWVALQYERSRRHPDAATRAEADAMVALLTPVVKAGFTDLGFEACVTAQQVFGGHGYIREWGMEQFVRDARIAMIYEGTNGVQAMDLAGRKLAMDGGATVARFLALVAAEADGPLRMALDDLSAATNWMQAADAEALGASAVDYLRLFALVALGWMWAKMAATGDATKGELARFHAQRRLSQSSALKAAITSGAGAVMALAAEDF